MKVLNRRRSCLGCRAYQKANLTENSKKCSLGYKVGIYPITLEVSYHRPLEQCPKPITWDKYNKEIKKCQKKRLMRLRKNI